MSDPNPRKVLGPIDPNPDITVPGTLIENARNPSSPLESKPFGSSGKDAQVTSQDSSRLEARFINVSKRKSRSSSRSKSDVDCPREIPSDAAVDDGQLADPGRTANEGPPFPSAIKIEPGLEPQDGLRIDDVKPTEPNLTPHSASGSEPNFTNFIPTVKVEIKKQLADVVDVKEEVSPEIVLSKKKAARVKVVSFAPSECWFSCQDSS